MVGYADTEKLIMDIADDHVKRDEFRNSITKDEKEIKDLLDGTELSSGSCDEVSIKFESVNSEKIYAKCKFLVFDTEDIAVIEWIEVMPPVTGNGVARTLRKEMLEDIGDRDIYTNIINGSMISVAIDQGFQQVQEGHLNGWFVRFS